MYLTLALNISRIGYSVKKLVRQYLLLIILVSIYGIVLGFIYQNMIAIIYKDLRVIVGFSIGCMLALSYLHSHNGYRNIIVIYYIISLAFILENLAAYYGFIELYRYEGLFRITNPLIFELAGYFIILTPTVYLLSVYNRRKRDSIIIILLLVFFIILSIFINVTRSLTISGIFVLIIILYLTRKMKMLSSQGFVFIVVGVSIFIFLNSNVLNILPMENIKLTALYRFNPQFNLSSDSRIIELADMFDQMSPIMWVIGSGLGSTFYSNNALSGMVTEPHMSIFTALYKYGALGFVTLIVWPFYRIMHLTYYHNKVFTSHREELVYLSNISGLLTFILIFTMSGGWSYETMILVGFNSFLLSAKTNMLRGG
jgi:hypothetical protein